EFTYLCRNAKVGFIPPTTNARPISFMFSGGIMAEEKQSEAGQEKENNRLSTLVALLIAVVSVSGAVVTWRASVSADGAGDADVAGIRATINLTETNALAAVKGY